MSVPPSVRGPASRGEANRVAGTVTRGLDQAAVPSGIAHIPHLALRLPAGASEADVTRAFERALADHRRRKEDRR